MIRVTSPPQKPLMVYDGECGFWTLWIHRWQCATRESVDYFHEHQDRMDYRWHILFPIHLQPSRN